jgi:hypothetical protein
MTDATRIVETGLLLVLLPLPGTRAERRVVAALEVLEPAFLLERDLQLGEPERLGVAERSPQRAVVGLNDLSARKTIRRLGKDLMTFTVPPELYAEMEKNLPGSFIERDTWKSLQEQ